jgi:hypothetical protein
MSAASFLEEQAHVITRNLFVLLGLMASSGEPLNLQFPSTSLFGYFHQSAHEKICIQGSLIVLSRQQRADHSGLAVYGLKFPCSLRHGDLTSDMSVRVSCVVLSCVGSGLAKGWSQIQGVLPDLYKIMEENEVAKAQTGLHTLLLSLEILIWDQVS